MASSLLTSREAAVHSSWTSTQIGESGIPGLQQLDVTLLLGTLQGAIGALARLLDPIIGPPDLGDQPGAAGNPAEPSRPALGQGGIAFRPALGDDIPDLGAHRCRRLQGGVGLAALELDAFHALEQLSVFAFTSATRPAST